MFQILEFLDTHSVRYKLFEHKAVFTCAEAREVAPDLPGVATKNLFLRDDKGKRHFILVTPDNKQVDLKRLGSELGVKQLGLASAERLQRFMGLEPGAVTLLGIVNDGENLVEVLLDKELANAEAICCHPLVNTSTLVIPWEDVLKFCSATKHVVQLIEVSILAN